MAESIDYGRQLDLARHLADRIARRRTELAEEGAIEAGFPVRVTMLEADLSVGYLETLGEELDWVRGKSPFGTVAAIFPYDAPVIMLARLGGCALLTGNRLRFSFSSWTRRTARLLADVAKPFGEFEPVVGEDNRDFGSHCVKDQAVRVLFMSGASAVGEAYRTHRDAFDKLFFAGPGGMPATLVFEDADIDAASRFIVRRAFINAGQYCTTVKKALIHEKLYPAIRDRVLELTATLKVGDPLDEATDIGPIRVERTRRLLEYALQQFPGAIVRCGGIDGEWVHPIVLEAETIPDLELFGPLLALKPFSDPEAAVQEATETRYGFLLSYFGIPPEGAAARFESHFGMVHHNPEFAFRPLRLPFGGCKASGWILERDGTGWRERDGAFYYSRELVRG